MNTHLALIKGEINAKDETLVRVHEPLSIFDFIAIIPFEFLLNHNYGLDGKSESDKFRILKLFRLLRLARFGELLKIERFK